MSKKDILYKFQKTVKEHTLEGSDDMFKMTALVGELGELANVMKKEGYTESDEMIEYKERVEQEIASGKRKTWKEQKIDEAGDTFFYFIQLLNDWDIPIEKIMRYQMEKLKSQDKQWKRTFKK